MKIYSPNPKYNGVTAGVVFTNGTGDTTDKDTIKYLIDRGYTKAKYRAKPKER